MRDAPLLVLVGMPTIAVATASALVLGYARARRDAPVPGAPRPAAIALGAAAWMALGAALAGTGALARWDARPPPLMPLVFGGVVLAALVARSRVGAQLARLPVAALVLFHAFRLPLELVMHEAASAGIMPPQMTFGAGWCNWDVVTGATAPLVAWLAHTGRAPRALVAAWAALGAGLLANVMTIGVASTPLFRAFGDEPARLNTWIAELPYVWLPSVLVVLAVLGHLVLARALLARAPARAAA